MPRRSPATVSHPVPRRAAFGSRVAAHERHMGLVEPQGPQVGHARRARHGHALRLVPGPLGASSPACLVTVRSRASSAARTNLGGIGHDGASSVSGFLVACSWPGVHDRIARCGPDEQVELGLRAIASPHAVGSCTAVECARTSFVSGTLGSAASALRSVLRSDAPNGQAPRLCTSL
jgi:hypothetical protein